MISRVLQRVPRRSSGQSCGPSRTVAGVASSGGYSQQPPSSGQSSGSGGGSDSGHKKGSGDPQAAIAKAYLRNYIKVRREGDLAEAMRLLQKATVAAEHVHVRLPARTSAETGWPCERPGSDRGGQVVPLLAIIPSIRHEGQPRPRLWSLLPESVDEQRFQQAILDEHASPEDVLADRPVHGHERSDGPVPLVLPLARPQWPKW
eukprot:TRINITY_DN47797_c0_g1_i1.p1 TRINITY_DN47797_c0_g1~~TRINITY_DN47797_c0_g1_i1.p1  ORF type:complete len:204 (-),score=40.03 TRINITY_DN47797_c0_g1_i1:95-706(-)